MIENILTDAGLDYTIRITDKGEKYAGFKVVFNNEGFPFTAILRNGNIRIVLHEVLKPSSPDSFFASLNTFNDKGAICKFYFNAVSGFVEGSVAISTFAENEISDQILFYIDTLYHSALALKSSIALSPTPEEDHTDMALPGDPTILPLLKSVLIENGYSARWKFERSVLATNLLTISGKKVILEFFLVDGMCLFIRSYAEMNIQEDKVQDFFARMQHYNWLLDTVAVAFNPDELTYYLIRTIPIRFLKADTEFIEDCISQALNAHEYIYNDLQVPYKMK
jgi:hypothetical protein